jgi:hypothetical protein
LGSLLPRKLGRSLPNLVKGGRWLYKIRAMRIRRGVVVGGIVCAIASAVVAHEVNAQGNRRDPAADWPTLTATSPAPATRR